jgi:hypothetical protein
MKTEIIVGQKYRVIDTYDGFNSCSGGYGTANNPSHNGEVIVECKSKGGNRYACEVVMIGGKESAGPNGASSRYNYNKWELEPVMCDREYIKSVIVARKEEVKKLEESIKEQESIIKWMDEVGVDTYDENEYKVYTTLSILENKDMNKVEMMREIANLLN